MMRVRFNMAIFKENGIKEIGQSDKSKSAVLESAQSDAGCNNYCSLFFGFTILIPFLNGADGQATNTGRLFGLSHPAFYLESDAPALVSLIIPSLESSKGDSAKSVARTLSCGHI
mmetsp:Transcript_13336/g.16780  ORF Transcript_13336/g.16780 Transcript_13336/m.16780 type:complete len:115 (-) Transcript_13336:381-725(-)